MLLRLPSSLHYPIRIISVTSRVNDYVTIDQPLFTYTYRSTVTEGRRGTDEDVLVSREFTTSFASTLEGTIKSWLVWEGDVIHEARDVCKVEEECPHEVQFNGLCTNCGKDLTQEGGGDADGAAKERAPIKMAHDTPLLTISEDEARSIDTENKRRLLAGKKLSLVVDLDQTIIHAAVDPTIGEWMRDTDNPNYDAVKHVRSFQLLDDGPGMRGCWYYIKLRPGLEGFLDRVAQLYELHIYTMGTRQYAKQIAQIVDPNGKYFGDRILSRDESGSMVAKNLERLFPIDSKMVVIIDDRGDVWKWSANLVRVTPFDFFVGIGDINSSFLPKKQEVQQTVVVEEVKVEPKAIEEAAADAETGAANGVAEDGTSTLQNGASALQNLLEMSGSNDAASRQEQAEVQEKTLATQLEEKPLEKMQREQDEKDAEQQNGETSVEAHDDSESSSTDSDSGTPRKHRHSILKDDDEELVHLEAALKAVHGAFFKEWDRRRASGKGGRVGALAGNRKAPLPETATSPSEDGVVDLSLVPDIKRIMPAMKVRVLSSVVIVFSGVLPLGTDIQSADISTWAKTFGATIREDISREVTHVIAARIGTAKVKKANRRGIKVVSTTWLYESMQQWRKLDERPYLLEGASRPEPASSPTESDHLLGPLPIPGDLLSDSEATDLSVSEDEDGTRPRKRLKLDTTLDAVDDDAEEYTPPTLNQEEYDKIQEELREFMGSDMDSDSDVESVRSELSVRAAKKRRRDDVNGDAPDGDHRSSNSNGIGGSRLKAVSNADHQHRNSNNNSNNGAITAAVRGSASHSAAELTAAEAEAEAEAEQEDDRLENERIAEDQADAEARDRHEQEVESDSDDEEQRELEEMLGGGSDDDDDDVDDDGYE